MMQKFSTPFKVGFVIIVGVVVTVVMIVRFSVNWGQEEGTYQLQAYFNDATGLALRSQIKVAGIQVGEVASITLDGARALVTFNVRNDVVLYEGADSASGRIHGATVAKKLSGILGDYHLELTPGLAGRPLQNGDFVPIVIQNSGIEGIMGNADAVLKDVSAITNNLAKVFGGEDGRAQLSSVINDLNDTIATIRNLTDESSLQVSSIVNNLETITRNIANITQDGNDSLPMLLNDVSTLVHTAQSTLDRMNTGVDSTLISTQQGIQDLRQAIEKLDQTLSHVEAMAQNVENGQGTVGKLLKDDGIANEAEALLAETRTLIKEGTQTVKDANSLLSPISSLDVDVSLRSDYFVKSNAFRVDFGIKLQPNFDKYYYLGLVMDPHGTTQTKTILTDSSATGSTYETITTNDDSIKFNLQYARRWRWFVGRFGIFENTGGIGGDVLLFDDDLRVTAELFAFNENEYPRMRATALVYTSFFLPWNWAKTFYLSTGLDDPLNDGLFDYFVGIGFRFTDNDLKSFVGMMPTK